MVAQETLQNGSLGAVCGHWPCVCVCVWCVRACVCVGGGRGVAPAVSDRRGPLLRLLLICPVETLALPGRAPGWDVPPGLASQGPAGSPWLFDRLVADEPCG